MEDKSKTLAPVARGRCTWWSWLLWLPGCVGFALLLAWASVRVSVYFSPLLIFPLLMGFILGAALVSLMRLCQMGHRPVAWLAVVLAVAAIVVGQHYFSYRSALVEAERQAVEFQKAEQAFGDLVQGRFPSPPADAWDYMTRQARQGRPIETVFGSFTAQGPVAWLSWGLDGLLIVLPAALMVGFALRRPFCGQCRSWYATRRSGRLRTETVEQLAKELGFSVEEPTEVTHYRLLCCDQGCTPTGFALSCEKRVATKLPAVLWLDDDQRNRVIEILDAARTLTTDS